jgi:uncharacterized protein (TIGR02246 family)
MYVVAECVLRALAAGIIRSVQGDPGASELRDALAIRALCERYAQAVDANDRVAFASLFTPDGHVDAYDGATMTPMPGWHEFRGRKQLAEIPEGVKAVAPTTMHFLGNHIAEVAGDHATGITYCVANHLRADRSNLVLMIRYLDKYDRTPEGDWLIADRRIVIDWTETRHADPPPT